MHPNMHGFSPSGFPSAQSPSQAYMSSPAMESPNQIGHAHMGPDSPYYGQRPASYDVKRAFEDLLSIGWDRRQIWDVCQPDHFSSFATIAAWLQRRQRSKSLKLSRAPAARYPSGVSSLRSNHSQWSASTDLSISSGDLYPSGFGNPLEGQLQTPFWNPVPGEMNAGISGGPGAHGTNTAMALVTAGPEQPQRQDFCQSTNALGLSSVYQRFTLPDAPNVAGGANANVSYGALNSISYSGAGGTTTTDNRPWVGGPDSAHRQSCERAARRDQIQYPCPEPHCTKKPFKRSIELGKHLEGDHEKNDKYVCQHDQECMRQTHRHATWARHHSRDHSGCKRGDECVEKIHDKKKKYWGCSICVHLSRDAYSHADHHQRHFKEQAAQPRDIKFSTMVQSLLSQEATKTKWEARCLETGIQVGNCEHAWQPSSCEEIRMALEYGEYHGFDISIPSIANLLLDEVVALMTGKRNRHASRIYDSHDLPNPEDSWLDVHASTFLDTTDADFTESY